MNCPRCKKEYHVTFLLPTGETCDYCTTPQEQQIITNIRRKAWNIPPIQPSLDAYVETEK